MSNQFYQLSKLIWTKKKTIKVDLLNNAWSVTKHHDLLEQIQANLFMKNGSAK